MAGPTQWKAFRSIRTNGRATRRSHTLVLYLASRSWPRLLGAHGEALLALPLMAGVLLCAGCGVSPTQSVAAKAVSSVLEISPSSLSFGSVNVGASSTQSVTLTSNGASSVTVEGASVTGAGFSVTGATFPLTLTAGQSRTLQVKFNPSSAGSATGTLTFTADTSSGGSVDVALSGSGRAIVVNTYSVDLSWQQPASSTAPVLGYYIYRTSSSGEAYHQLNESLSTSLSYTDDSVQAGNTYSYYVTSVATSGLQSPPSNLITLTVP